MARTDRSRPDGAGGGTGDGVTAAGGVRTPSRRGRFPSPRLSAVIARMELRRMGRRVRSQDVWLALTAVSALVVVAVMPLLFAISRGWGEAFASGDAAPTSTIVLVVAVAWGFQVAMAVVAGVGSYGEIDNAAAMLTIRPPKDVAGGMLLMNAAAYAVYLAVPFGVGFAGIAVGAGTPFPLVGGAVVTAAILASSMAVGYPAGLAIKGIVRRSATLSRLKPVIGAVAVVGYFWIMFAGHLPVVVDLLEPVLREPPLGWLGDLALATTPGAGVSPHQGAVALALAVVLVPVGSLATVRAATFAWYADEKRGPSADDGTGTPSAADSRSAAGSRIAAGSRSVAGGGEGSVTHSRPPTPAAPTAPNTPLSRALGVACRRQSTLGVASTTLVRAYRAPLQLVFVAAPLLFALPMVEGIVRSGTVPEYAPWFAMLYGAWAAGVAFPLNLLGTQGAALPALLTARADGRAIVHGHVVAAVVPLAPVTAGLAAAAAHGTGRSVPETMAIAGLSLVVVTAGAVLAAGFGARFPRFESIDVTGGRTAMPPSKAAFALYSVLLTLAVTAAGIVTDEVYHRMMYALLSEYLPFGLDVSMDGLEAMALGLVPVLAVLVVGAYVVAVRRIDGYRIE